jgi:hypothetical protein
MLVDFLAKTGLANMSDHELDRGDLVCDSKGDVLYLVLKRVRRVQPEHWSDKDRWIFRVLTVERGVQELNLPSRYTYRIGLCYVHAR